MNKATIGGLITAAALTLTLAACGELGQDAGVTSRDVGPAEIYNMPDGFSNFAEKCDAHGNRVFTIFHGDSHTGSSPYGGIAVSPHDPTCRGVENPPDAKPTATAAPQPTE